MGESEDESSVIPEDLGAPPRLRELSADLLDVVEGYPGTPEGIELYEVHLRDGIEARARVPVQQGEPREQVANLPELRAMVELKPVMEDRYRGLRFRCGWSEELRVVVLWVEP